MEKEETTKSGEPIPLTAIEAHREHVVHAVREGHADVEGGDIGLRLAELGFVEGERVRVVAFGHPGRDPLAVRIAGATFALRRFEAEHVMVTALAQDQ